MAVDSDERSTLHESVTHGAIMEKDQRCPSWFREFAGQLKRRQVSERLSGRLPHANAAARHQYLAQAFACSGETEQISRRQESADLYGGIAS